MQKLEMALLRTTQLILCLFFTFAVLVYVSSAIVIPLAVLMGVISVLDHGLGFNGIFAFIVAAPAVVWLFYKLYQIPHLANLLMETGANLLKMAAKNFKDFDEIAKTVKGEQSPQQG
jgi:hypothetical protein